jgi:hypothetical protein
MLPTGVRNSQRTVEGRNAKYETGGGCKSHLIIHDASTTCMFSLVPGHLFREGIHQSAETFSGHGCF